MPLKDYLTVAKESEIEIVIQKSRFIGRCYPVQEEQEAIATLERIRKQHWDASHNCYAYVLGENGQIARYSDDGEPGGTAGLPMMEVLKRRDLQQLLVIVTRYFGGTLLGAGGLVRAYSKACSEAVSAAGLVHYCVCEGLLLEMPYPLWGKIERFLQHQDVLMDAPEFSDKVAIVVWLPIAEAAAFEKALIAQSEGRIDPKRLGESYKAWPMAAECD